MATVFPVVWAVVFGLIIGSFINAWAYRLAHDMSIAHGRSICPQCRAPIRAYDNIPLLSWLLLRGRCRDCGAPISIRYPIGEALTGALFGAVVAVDGVSWVVIPELIFVATMVLVSEVDLEKRIIPDVVILPATVVGLPLMIAFGPAPWWQWPVAGLGAAAFLLLISEVYYRVRHIEGMGFGDVKMALCMGVYLGASVIPAVFIGFLGGALVGIAVVAVRKGDAKTALPFGPFLAAGAVICLFAGQEIIAAYMSLAFHSR